MSAAGVRPTTLWRRPALEPARAVGVGSADSYRQCEVVGDENRDRFGLGVTDSGPLGQSVSRLPCHVASPCAGSLRPPVSVRVRRASPETKDDLQTEGPL